MTSRSGDSWSTRSVYGSTPAIVANTPRRPWIRSASPYARPRGLRSTSRPAASSRSRYADRRSARSDGTTSTFSYGGIQGLLARSWTGSWNGHGRRRSGPWPDQAEPASGSWLVAPHDASSLELVARQGPGRDRGHLDADPEVSPDGLGNTGEGFPLS